VKNQPPTAEIKAALTEAGFSNVSHTMIRHALALKTDEWCTMVQNRFWSTFSHFTDAELQAGTDEIRSNAGGSDTLEFEERMIIITATK
jgi:hypothetical protein